MKILIFTTLILTQVVFLVWAGCTEVCYWNGFETICETTCDDDWKGGIDLID